MAVIEVQAGDLLIYVDEYGDHNALVTTAWLDADAEQMIVNLTYVSGDINKQDCQGRQLERKDSVLHETVASGIPYWKVPT